nr:hypothetical protein [Tanacetum cinerariifolium]
MSDIGMLRVRTSSRAMLAFTLQFIYRILQSHTQRYPVRFQAQPLPDYVPGPEEPEQAPLLPDFVSEHVYPKFMPPEDEVCLAEEQLLPAAVSPTTNSPRYIPESSPEEDDEDPEEDPADYPTEQG